jgi:hypothetical protein
MRRERERSEITPEQVARWLPLLAAGVVACFTPASADTFWHLRAGQDIALTGHVSLVDQYSYTAAGSAWPDHEWLWQLATYGAFRLGGMPLVTAFAAALLLGAFALAQDLAAPPWWLRLPLFMAAILLTGQLWAVRPQVFTMLALLGVVWLIAHRRLRYLPPIFLLWANVHGAVLLGLLVLAVAILVAGLRRERAFALRLAAASVACAALTLATPLGFGLLRFIGESMQRSRANGIAEWRTALAVGPKEAGFWLAAGALTLASLRLWRRLPTFADQLIVASALLFVPLGFRAVRNIGPFALLAFPAASRLLAASASPRVAALSAWLRARMEDAPGTSPQELTRRSRRQLAVAAAVGVALVTFGWSRPLGYLNWTPIAPEARAAIRDCSGRVFNEYDEGGYLVWFVPEQPVFIDSRQDPYPVEFLQRARELARDPLERARAFAAYGIRCAALSASSEMAGQLAGVGWRETFRDRRWVVLAE